MENALSEVRSQKQTLQNDYDALVSSNADLQNDYDDLSETAARDAASLADKISALESKERELSDLLTRYNTLEDDYAALDQKEKSEAARIEELEEQVNNLQTAKTGLENSLKDTQDQLTALQAQYDALSGTESDTAKALAEKISELQDKENTINTMTSAMEELQTINTSLQNQLDTLTNEKQALQEQYNNLSDTNSEQAQTILDQLKDLGEKEAKINEMSDTISGLNASNTNLNKQLSEIASQKEALQDKYNELEDKSGEQAQQILSQMEDLTAQQRTIEGLQDAVQTLTDTNEELKNDLKDVRDEKASLQSQLDNVTNQNSVQAQQLKDKISELDKKEKEITELMDKISNLETSNDDLKKENEKLTKDIDATKDASGNDVATLQKQLAEQKKELEELHNKYDEVAAELDLFKEAYKETGIGFMGKNDDGEPVVFLQAVPYVYNETPVDYEYGGHVYKLYTGYGDPLGKGSSTFQFYLGEAGTVVHVLDGNDNEAVYTQTLWDMVYKADNMLSTVQQKLNDLDDCTEEIIDIFNNAGYHIPTSDDAQANMESVKEAVKSMIKTYDTVKDEYADLKSAVYGGTPADEKSLAETIDTLNSVYAKTSVVVDELEKALDTTVDGNDREALDALLEKVKQMRESVGTDLQMANDVRKALGLNDDGDALATIQALYGRIAELEFKLDQASAKTKSLEVANSKLASENNDLKKATPAAQVTTVEYRTDTRLENENKELSDRNDVLTTLNTDLVSTNGTLKEENEALIAENAGLTNENASLRSENADLKNQLASAGTSHEQPDEEQNSAQVEMPAYNEDHANSNSNAEYVTANSNAEHGTSDGAPLTMQPGTSPTFGGTSVDRIQNALKLDDTMTEAEVQDYLLESMEAEGFTDENTYLVAKLEEMYDAGEETVQDWVAGNDVAFADAMAGMTGKDGKTKIVKQKNNGLSPIVAGAMGLAGASAGIGAVVLYSKKKGVLSQTSDGTDADGKSA